MNLIDAIVMGRKTWDVSVAMGGGPSGLSTIPTYVFSRTLTEILLSSGVPLFRDPGKRITLALKESRTLHGGCVFSNYSVR